MGKREVLELIKKMPAKISVDDILYEIFVQMKIEKGIKQLDEGKGITHGQAKKKLPRWLRR